MQKKLRRRVPAPERRDQYVTYRATLGEKLKLKRRAKARGQSLTDFCRYLAGMKG